MAKKARQLGFEAYHFGSFMQTVGLLRKKVPLVYPVIVRRIKMANDAGTCELDRKSKWRFLIKIDASLSQEAAILILFHEWAHAMIWNPAYNNGMMEDHGPEWGVCYAKIWQTLFESEEE